MAFHIVLNSRICSREARQFCTHAQWAPNLKLDFVSTSCEQSPALNKIMSTAKGWRRRALRLVEHCLASDAEHVLCKALRLWPVAALCEATQEWTPELFALVARDWRMKKLVPMLKAKGKKFTAACCEEWEPEFLPVLLPELGEATVKFVLGKLYFKSDDKHLSAWECRAILDRFAPGAQKRLLANFSEKAVSRVMRAAKPSGLVADEVDADEDDESEEGDSDLEGFVVDGDDDTEMEDGGEGEEETDSEEGESGEGASEEEEESEEDGGSEESEEKGK